MRKYLLKGIGMLLLVGASFVMLAIFVRQPDKRAIEIAPVTLVEVLQNMQRKGRLILDVRDPGAYRYGHIPTAVNIPEDELRSIADAKLKAFKEAPVVIVYCGSTSCGSSFYAA